MTRGVLLQVAYDGTGFCGWARQRDQRGVEEVVQEAIAAMDPHASRIRGSSRTDAGVHADCQMVAFDTEKEIEARGWVLGINQHLPEAVAVQRGREVPPGFAPRFSAVWKRYRYSIHADPLRHPRYERTHWYVRFPLDDARMKDAAQRMIGRHDFRAFRSTSDERENTERDIRKVEIERKGAEIFLVVEGDGFLHNMVRIIAGTLVDVARGKIAPGAVSEALASGDRRVLGTTAPAHGLCLAWTELGEVPEAGAAWP